MKNVLLTSTGFENENIKNKFLSLLKKSTEDAKILFIITAANNPDAVRILSKCLDDLTNCNIADENITVYDMHKVLSKKEILEYDAIYVCGGSTRYLLERMNEINFKDLLIYYLDNGGIYIGVSAGTVAYGNKYSNGLSLMDNKIDVHCEVGSNNGNVVSEETIKLTNNQAIYDNGEKIEVFE